jgi:hypothetical protein
MKSHVLGKMRVAKRAVRLEMVRSAVVRPLEQRLSEALVKLRSTCRHAGRIVELYLLDIRGTVTEDVVRFCLTCGEMEWRSARLSVPSTLPAFTVIRRAKSVIRTECDWTLFRMLSTNYRERLHEKALFNEYDAKGVWRGWSGPIAEREA